MAFGTLSSLDSLAAVRQSVADYGEDNAWASINAALAAYNRQIDGMTGDLMERTTDTQRAYGTMDTKVMQEMDQWGSPDAQKVTAGVTVGFPLRRYGDALQWTRQFQTMQTVGQLAAEIDAIATADRRNLIRAAKVALFTSTNASFVDKLGGGPGSPANVTLAVKALVNNDGANLPVGPNGETFATSHTHYLANASLTAAVVINAIVTVQEHYNSGTPVVYISQTDEAAFRALTGFIADVDTRIVQPQTATYTTVPVNYANLYDRRIGLFNGAEVWITPWMIANYCFVYVRGAPVPLAMRVPAMGTADLELVYDDERHPLRARGYQRMFGIGVWNRTNGAILQFNNGTYTIPTIP
jgi:hypothetical protein